MLFTEAPMGKTLGQLASAGELLMVNRILHIAGQCHGTDI